ncbi:hypothetical protein BDA96_03G381600 [Sorghum bicolor]|uniref:Uncharacterized protein n=1 Tax=Sorghum bicolor TaxID=4558 RepID=A0A921RH27_SORBI|nr:hypothetical protein BDA96_03G381600 [Sorghum bicolor]
MRPTSNGWDRRVLPLPFPFPFAALGVVRWRRSNCLCPLGDRPVGWRREAIIEACAAPAAAPFGPPAPATAIAAPSTRLDSGALRRGGGRAGTRQSAPLAHGAAGCQELGVPGCRRDRCASMVVVWWASDCVLSRPELLMPVRQIPTNIGGGRWRRGKSSRRGGSSGDARQGKARQRNATILSLFFASREVPGTYGAGPASRTYNSHKSERIAVGDLAKEDIP